MPSLTVEEQKKHNEFLAQLKIVATLYTAQVSKMATLPDMQATKRVDLLKKQIHDIITDTDSILKELRYLQGLVDNE